MLWIVLCSYTTQEKLPNDSIVYEYVEQMPEFPGGTSELIHYWSSNLKIPDIKSVEVVSTRILVQFIIEKDGTASHPVVLQSIHPSQNESLIEIVQKMPKWKPGKQNGETVRVRFTIPINVNLRFDK